MQTLDISYDFFSEEWYKRVEKVVLKDNKFNEEQKKFIHFFESGVIEAGPGSGKTTALAAKVALLLKKIEENGISKGICVITHTNAAVEEILKVLNKFGYKEIPHPHFIGTINQFFNRYGMYPYLKDKNRNLKDIHFADDNELENYFKNKLSKIHRWLNMPDRKDNANKIIRKLVNSHLYIDKKGELNCKTYQSGAFDKYKEDYLFYKNKSWHEGVFHMNDTFCISQKYFKHELVKKRLRERFTYLLMDEYQDISLLPLFLLKNLFLVEGNIFQMIGDRNQHIAYSNQEVPTKGFNTYYLNQTNRFGDYIANPLNRMFNNKLKATESGKSLKPILLIYNEPEKLSDYFIGIARGNKIKVSINHDQMAILVAARSQAGILGQSLSKSTQRKIDSVFQKAQDLIYKLLSKKTNIQFQSIKKILINDCTSYHLMINEVLLDFFRGKSTNELILKKINSYLEIIETGKTINLNNKIFRELAKLKEEKTRSIGETTPGIPIKTIHDLKGQTLMGNMLFLDKKSKEEYGFLESYGAFIEQPKYYDEIDKRVVFVAMSRPTTLLIVALHEETYSSLTEEARLKIESDFVIHEGGT